MSDLATALVKHCRADSTLIAIVPAAQIKPEPTAGGTLPELSIVPLGTSDGRGSPYHMVRFTVRAKLRSATYSAQARLYALFHNQAGYTLATGTPALFCVQSMRAGMVGPEKDDDNGAWECSAEFEFQIPSA